MYNGCIVLYSLLQFKMCVGSTLTSVYWKGSWEREREKRERIPQVFSAYLQCKLTQLREMHNSTFFSQRLVCPPPSPPPPPFFFSFLGPGRR